MVVTLMEVAPVNCCISQQSPCTAEEYLSTCTHSVLSSNPPTSGLNSLHCLFHHSFCGFNFLDNQLLSSQGILGSSCFNAFIKTFSLFFCGFPSPTLYSFAWLQMILSSILRQLFMKLTSTLCFLRNSIPNIVS